MEILSGERLWAGVHFLVLCLGIPARAAEVDLVPSNAGWHHLPGITEASTPNTAAWGVPGFSDASGASGVLPLFVGEDLSGSLITGMQDSHLSHFVRTRFTLTTPADVRNRVLHAACDDGFVARVNGGAVEIQGRPVVGGGLWERAATFPAGPGPEERLAFVPSQAMRFSVRYLVWNKLMQRLLRCSSLGVSG
jgi:hypothetical protein